MSILNVNQIQPVGGGNTITVSASDVSASGATITASSFVGNVTGNLTGNVTGNLTGNVTGNVTSSSTSTFSSGLNVTGGNVGIGTDSAEALLDVEGIGQFGNNPLTDTGIQLNGSVGRIRVGRSGNVFEARNGSDSTIKASISGSTGGANFLGSVGIGTDDPRTKLDVDGGLIVKVSGTQPAWVSNAITGQEKFSIWQGASFDNACFNLDVDNSQSFLNHNVYYYNSSWRQRLGGHTPIMIQLSSSNGVVFQKSSDNGAGTNDTATTLTELCRINTSGNLAFPSGQGIDFSATSDGSGTATSELLDDYEEGTWTPTLSNTWSAPAEGASPVYSGRYTKVGNKVTCYLQFDFDSATNYALHNRFSFTGLPYTSSSNYTELPAIGTVWVYSSIGSGNNAFGQISCNTNATVVYIYITSIDGTVAGNTNGTAGFTYFTDS